MPDVPRKRDGRFTSVSAVKIKKKASTFKSVLCVARCVYHQYHFLAIFPLHYIIKNVLVQPEKLYYSGEEDSNSYYISR